MKKFVVSVIVMLSFFAITSNFATAQIGPFSLEKGEIKLGIFFESYGNTMKIRNNITEEKLYSLSNIGINLEYGITDNVSVKLALGNYELTIFDKFSYKVITEEFIFPYHKHFNDRNLFGTVEIKKIIFESQKFSLVPFVQATYYAHTKDSRSERFFFPSYNTNNTKPFNTKQFVIDAIIKNQYKIDLGIIGQYIFGRINVYAGPFAYWTRADSEFKLQVKTEEKTLKTNIHYREKDNIGGVLGVNIAVGKKFSVNAELQRGKSMGFFGLMISKVF